MHIGIIMDGNRRWAQNNGLNLEEAYEKGLENLLQILEEIKTNPDLDIKELTIFVLSHYNLKQRNIIEQKIFANLITKVVKDFEKLVPVEFAVRFKGDLSNYPELKILERPWGLLKLNLCFNYSSIQEIEDLWAESTWKDAKEKIGSSIDMIIRTGGYQRLSDFCLIQAAFSELYFIENLWPDFKKEDLNTALLWFKKQKRNFGQ